MSEAPIMLEGGCFVTSLRAGQPDRHGTMTVWDLIGRKTGAGAISLRTIELARGASPAWRNPECDEVLYVLSGEATALLDGRPCPVAAETGIHLARGATLQVEVARPAPLVLVSSRCPDPGAPSIIGPPAGPGNASRTPIVRLADREACPTGDRWYRVLIDADAGCREVTQFVGSIPPGRAPDHYHHYEEVLCILHGQGVMWAGGASTPVAEGSCIFLPRGQVHCVENTGATELRLLGVFYPAGSPAVRYDPSSPAGSGAPGESAAAGSKEG